MRITKEAKERNRIKILEVAERLFAENGYENTTTRDISSTSGIAKGTLFNYFSSKETLAMIMVEQAMESGRKMYLRRRSGDESLAEEIFLFISSELRALKSFRRYIGPVLESSMSIFEKKNICLAGKQARTSHLKTIRDILASHGYQMENDSIPVTLYWALYLGILAHWSGDVTKNQTETLALVDYSVQTFVNTISTNIDVRGAACNE